MAQQYMILGKDARDAEARRDTWLSEHPEIKILRLHPPQPEPSLLTRFAGSNVPRVSIVVEYEEVAAPNFQSPALCSPEQERC